MYKQKVKHLLYEHQNNISTLKADGELGLKLAGEEAAKREAELQKDCRNLKLELKEQVSTSACFFISSFLYCMFTASLFSPAAYHQPIISRSFCKMQTNACCDLQRGCKLCVLIYPQLLRRVLQS